MKTYTVTVLVVPPSYEILLGVAKIEHKTIQIQGTSLADAKKRAGIQ